MREQMVASAEVLARKAVRRYRLRRALNERRHPRLGFYAPLPPVRTEPAAYARAVLDGLRRIGFLDRYRMKVTWPVQSWPARRAPSYALCIYVLANDAKRHADIYRIADQTPGLVDLHDLALDGFIREIAAGGDPLGFAAERESDRLRERLRNDPDAARSEPLRDPWCGHVLQRARGVIVHSAFCARYVEKLGRTPVFVVPYPPIEREQDMRAARARRRELRASAVAGPEDVLVVAPGDLEAERQPDALLKAVALLDVRVRVAFVGRRVPGFDVESLVRASGLGERATVAADVG